MIKFIYKKHSGIELTMKHAIMPLNHIASYLLKRVFVHWIHIWHLNMLPRYSAMALDYSFYLFLFPHMFLSVAVFLSEHRLMDLLCACWVALVWRTFSLLLSFLLDVICCFLLHCGHASNFPLSLKPLKVIAFFLTTQSMIQFDTFKCFYSVTHFILLVAFLKGKDINKPVKHSSDHHWLNGKTEGQRSDIIVCKEDGRTWQVETGR